jgi:hypothetical protein
MFLIRIVLGMKNVCFVYIFKHMIKAYLNSEIDIEICVINNADKCVINNSIQINNVYYKKIK